MKAAPQQQLAPYDSIQFQISRRLNNGRPNDQPHKKYSMKIFLSLSTNGL